MDSPSSWTIGWSATVFGLVKKKKARVMWKKQSEVRMVFADMSAMVAVLGLGLFGWLSLCRGQAEDIECV